MLSPHNATSFSVFVLPDSESARKRVREEDIDWPQFESGVDNFMASMASYYSSEKGRNGQALYYLNDI